MMTILSRAQIETVNDKLKAKNPPQDEDDWAPFFERVAMWRRVQADLRVAHSPAADQMIRDIDAVLSAEENRLFFQA